MTHYAAAKSPSSPISERGAKGPAADLLLGYRPRDSIYQPERYEEQPIDVAENHICQTEPDKPAPEGTAQPFQESTRSSLR